METGSEMMRHALGVQRLWNGRWSKPSRNYFVAGEGADDVWCSLAANGMAKLVSNGNGLTGGCPVFTVTDAGRAHAAALGLLVGVRRRKKGSPYFAAFVTRPDGADEREVADSRTHTADAAWGIACSRLKASCERATKGIDDARMLDEGGRALAAEARRRADAAAREAEAAESEARRRREALAAALAAATPEQLRAFHALAEARGST